MPVDYVMSAYSKRWHLLTYCMVQSPSWEANWFEASQEIPRISRNPKVHYVTHKRPPPVPILGPPSPVHIPTSHLLEIRPNIIHPSTPRSPQCYLSVMFLSEWREFPSAPCLAGKRTWWQLASPCCRNRTRPWHASELVFFLVWLRTYQHPGTCVATGNL